MGVLSNNADWFRTGRLTNDVSQNATIYTSVRNACKTAVRQIDTVANLFNTSLALFDFHSSEGFDAERDVNHSATKIVGSIGA